jgi:hypothetical protein
MKDTKINNMILQLLTSNFRKYLGGKVTNFLVENKILFSFHAKKKCVAIGKILSSHPNRPPPPKS